MSEAEHTMHPRTPCPKTNGQWLAEAHLILDGCTWLAPRREHLLALVHEHERREMKRAVITLGLNGNFP